MIYYKRCTCWQLDPDITTDGGQSTLTETNHLPSMGHMLCFLSTFVCIHPIMALYDIDGFRVDTFAYIWLFQEVTCMYSGNEPDDKM